MAWKDNMIARADRTRGLAGDRCAPARDRLDAAYTERSRLQCEYQSAKGTAGELQAGASLGAADVEVEARERWLEWVDQGQF